MADGDSWDKQIVEKSILQKLSMSISRDWLDVGRSLMLDEDTLQNIKADCHGRQKEAVYQMLLEWKKVNGEYATNGVFLTALENARRADLAHKLKGLRDHSNSTAKLENQQSTIAEAAKVATENVPGTRTVLPHYSMGRKPRGKCLILTYDKFKKSPKRTGNKVDMAKLEEIFETTLEFDVETKLNLGSEETHKAIQDIADADHTDYDCFVCCICSHGDGEAIVTTDEDKITIQDILTPFKSGKCKSLAGKPKLFFINACLGEAYHTMVQYEKDGPMMPADAGVVSKLANYAPNEADFCVVLSTVPGYVSLRDTKKGTIFVQSLHECLMKTYKDHHLVDILTLVNDRVNQEFTRIAHERGGGANAIGQVSTLVQTLNKVIYF